MNKQIKTESKEKMRKLLAYIFIPNTFMGFAVNTVLAGLYLCIGVGCALFFPGVVGFLYFVVVSACFITFGVVVIKKTPVEKDDK